MPRSKGKSFTFWDKEGKNYPFYAKNESTAISYAKAWAKKRGIRLFRKRG